MQSIQFKREKMNNYMVLPCNKYIDRSSYRNTVIQIVEIPGLMSCQIREVDGEQSLYYRLKYRTSVKQVLGDLKLTNDKVKNMISSIAGVIKHVENYLLDVEHILWKSDCIFIEVSSGRLVFTYYPGLVESPFSLKDFLTELVQYVDKGNQQTYMYIMGFYNLVTNPDCSVEQLEEYVDRGELQRDRVSLYIETLDKESKIEEQGNLQVDERALEQDKQERKKSKFSFSIIILSAVNLVVVCLLLFDVWTYQYIWVLVITLFLLFVAFLTGGTSEEESLDNMMQEYLQEYQNDTKTKSEGAEHSAFLEPVEEETTILSVDKSQIVLEENVKELCLKAMNPKAHKDIFIDKKSVVLGSMRAGCDYVLKENGISRMHAKLMKKEDELYLMDMNSTNGTYLNEEELVGGEEYLLKEGDVISLSYMVNFVVVEREDG